MYIYIIIFIFSSILFFQHKKYSHFLSKLVLFLSSLPLIIVSGLRSVEVGTDTVIYEHMFNYIKDDSLSFLLNDVSIFNEPLFVYLQQIIKYSSGEFTDFLVMLSFFISFLYLSTISKYSKSLMVSFFVFYFWGFFFLHFNIQRQGLTLALMFFSIRFIFERKLFYFSIVSIISFFIHKSSIVFFPAYFLHGISMSKRNIFIGLILYFLILACMPFTISYLSLNVDSRYELYTASRDEDSGLLQFLFYLFMFIVIFVFRFLSRYEFNSEEKFYFKCVLLGVVLYSIAIILRLDPNGIGRAALYYIQMFILLLPLVFLSLNNIYIRILFVLLFSTFSFIYFYLTATRFGNLIPYTFI